MSWRVFGQAEDLDIDFTRASRNAVVSHVLETCGADSDPESLPLGARIGALAEILGLTRSATALQIDVWCSVPACGETYQVDLPLDSIVDLASEAMHRPIVEVPMDDGTPLRLRRPTGEHQRLWQTRRFASMADAELALLQSLLVDSERAAELDEPQVALIDRSMEELDPLPCFGVVSRCPECGDEGDHLLDLEAWLLARLQRLQRSLLAEVHRFAERYGWTEAQTLRIPAWRRQAYLELIEKQAS